MDSKKLPPLGTPPFAELANNPVWQALRGWLDSQNVAREKLMVCEEEAAGMLCASINTLRRWRCEGTGPVFIKISQNKIGYRVRDIEAWLEERAVRSTSEYDNPQAKRYATRLDLEIKRDE